MHNKIPEASFLFGKDIGDYIDVVNLKIAEQQVCLIQIHQEGPYAKQEVFDKRKAMALWFHHECLAVKAKFSPYLSFHAWR